MCPKPTVEEFFSDPKYADDSAFMKGAVKKVLAEIATEEMERRKKEEAEKPKPKKELSFLEGLFGSDDNDEKDVSKK